MLTSCFRASPNGSATGLLCRRPLLLLGLAFLAGCSREEIRVYRVPKEQPATAPGHADSPHAAVPGLAWRAPAGWQEQPASGMTAARFRIAGPNGVQAEASAMPFPGTGASELSIINIVRQSAGLGPLSEQDLAPLTQAVTIGDGDGKLMDLSAATGGAPAEKSDGHIFVAMRQREGVAWFFKLAGDSALVAAQKPAFIEFLKSVSFRETPPVSLAAAENVPGTDAASTDSGAPNLPQWEVPAGWQSQPPSSMLLARFSLAGAGDTKAEVTVSVFPGSVGGLLANVNRWRGQVKLEPVGEADLPKVTERLELAGGPATLVDVQGTDAKTGRPARLIGAIVPRGGQTWFYKLFGSEEIAAREKDAFVKFVQSVKY